MQELSNVFAANREAGMDFDAHRRTEAALRDRERELSQLVDMVPSHLWRLTPDGEPIFFNQRMVDYLGLNVSDTDRPGMSRLEAVITTTVHPDDAAMLRQRLGHSLTTGETFALRYRLRRRDGVYRWMSSRAEAVRDELGTISQWYGLCHDIDDQIRAEEALRQNEQQLQKIVDTVPVAIWSFTSDGTVTYASKRNLEHLGLTELNFEDFARITAEVTHPDDAPAALAAAAEGFRTGSAFSARYRRRVNGVYRWTEGRAEPLRSADGSIVQWYAVSMDVDDEVRAVEALRHNEQQLQQLIDAVPVRIWSAASDGKPAYFNKRYRDHFRSVLANFEAMEAPTVIQMLRELVHPDDARRVEHTLRACFETGESASMRFRWLEDEGYRWAECRVAPRRDQNQNVTEWYGVSLDIDEDVRTQEELRHTQERLAVATQAASLAELSASVAHEVNQPLAAVVANSQAAQRWLAADPPNLERAKGAVERIIRDANGAADVVSRIRALFRQTKAGRSPARLDTIIDEARAFLAEEVLRRRVRLELDIESGLPAVPLDRVQIQQVLINLMRNGIEAMAPVKGDRVLRIALRRTGDVLQTEISDCGPGIEFPERMFEPFFSTKEHGMGMGLAICRTIVEAHGGRLWAENNEPRGARLSFKLPVETRNE